MSLPPPDPRLFDDEARYARTVAGDRALAWRQDRLTATEHQLLSYAHARRDLRQLVDLLDRPVDVPGALMRLVQGGLLRRQPDARAGARQRGPDGVSTDPSRRRSTTASSAAPPSPL